MDYLKSLAVFIRVAELGNFSAVAQEFDVSGTMIGKHIQALERRLGGKLIARSTRRQSLTDLGALFLERARAILADIETADALADEIRQQPRGTLRVSAPTALGVERLVDVIADYREHYPEVDVELSITDRVVDLVDEGFHVAIRTGDEIHQDLIARPLSPYRMLACASPAYLASHPPIEKPQDLEGHQCLEFAQWGRHPVWRFQQGNDIRTVPVSGGFRSDSVLALRRAAINGQGVTVQAETLVAEPVANGQLQQVLPGWQLRARPTLIVWPPHMRNSAKLRSFVDFVTTHLGDGYRG